MSIEFKTQNDFDFIGFVEEYQATGKYDVEAIIENLDDNGCLDDYRQNVIRATINTILSDCVKWVYGTIPVLTNADKLSELYGENVISNINWEYVKHNIANLGG